MFECIWKILPMRSFLPLVELRTWAPDSTLPEYTRNEGQLAVEGVSGDLERQSGERLVLVGLTDLGLFLGLRAGEEAANAPMSSGEGRKSTTASRTGCTPMLRRAVPQ